ncbi:hypothetical protein NDR87_19310 [Nocardia sp. CDC159]|uniref:Uncharacterized protein n=1 Tax=Nocardia pulmonis TaxID=2951408 RepID=A0A9X2E8B8_9NOCA|nr:MULTISPECIES: hypothetical protein [Nocardia]MCM6776159.1 hypothetical protein [Nocardia pulmonis]MCM6788514.1 hypothetical protein [Nocardia sp. CDC159]
MDYAAEIERILAEGRRRNALLLDEIDEVNRQTAEQCRRLTAQWEAEAAEQARTDQAARDRIEDLARMAAARAAERPATWADDEDDEYYRRKSWLV